MRIRELARTMRASLAQQQQQQESFNALALPQVEKNESSGLENNHNIHSRFQICVQPIGLFKNCAAQVVSPYDDKVIGNPIGYLQEICLSRRWPPPSYEIEHEGGRPHERQFTISCQVLKFRKVGTAKTKKLAKRMAAYDMWQFLQDIPHEGSTLPLVSDEDVELAVKLCNVQGRYDGLKDTKIPTITTTQSQKVSQFHKALKQANGPKLNNLQNIHLNNKDINFIQILQEIADEQNFEVTYADVEEKSVTGRTQCLLQISTLPIAVCLGTGHSLKDAQASAAHHALEYLKITTKK